VKIISTATSLCSTGLKCSVALSVYMYSTCVFLEWQQIHIAECDVNHCHYGTAFQGKATKRKHTIIMTKFTQLKLQRSVWEQGTCMH